MLAPPYAAAPGGHPRLYVGPEDLEELRLRARAPREPYTTLMARLRAGAARQLRDPDDPTEHDPYALKDNALVAKAAAAVATVDGEGPAAEQARAVMASFQDDVSTLPFTRLDKGTIHTGMALADLSVAYDLLVGTGLLQGDAQAAAADRLGRLASSFEQTYRERFQWFVSAALNNHTVKFAAGLGLAGLVLPEHPRSAAWVAYAQTVMEEVLFGAQLAGGAAWAEGPYYLRFAAESYLPYLLAYHRLHAGERYRFPWSCELRLDDCVPHDVELGDLLTRPELAELHRWVLAISMPGGLCPNIDDSDNRAFFGGITASLHRDPELLWHWEQTVTEPRYSAGAALALETLLTYDEELQPAEPAPRHLEVLPEQGTAVLRSSWDHDAHYLLLLGESGAARRAGTAHDHVDATSLSLHALGEYLLLDSGYPGFGDRLLTASGEDHNLVLVDGLGPELGTIFDPGVDAFLAEGVREPDVVSAVVRANYQGTEVERHAALLDGRWAIVATALSSEAARVFEHLLHGHAGGDTGHLFEMFEHGARWQRPTATLTAWVLSTAGPVQHAAREDDHKVVQRRGTHAVLTSSSSAQELAFLAVLLPTRPGEEPPTVTPFDAGPARVGVVLQPTAGEGAEAEAPWFVVASVRGLAAEEIALPDGDPLPCAEVLHVTR